MLSYLGFKSLSPTLTIVGKLEPNEDPGDVLSTVIDGVFII